MLQDVLLRILWSGIEYIGMMIFILSLFRLPIKENFLKIIIISFVLSVIVIVFRNVISLTNYSILSLILSQVLLCMYFFRIPFFYALLLSNMSYLTLTSIEAGLMYLGISINITSVKLILTNQVHLAGTLLSTTIVQCLLAYLLHIKKLGFIFNNEAFSVKNVFYGYNLLISVVPIIGMIIMQIALISFHQLSLTFYSFAGMSITLLIGIYFAYGYNKELIINKYGIKS